MVVISSAGRPELLQETVLSVLGQTERCLLRLSVTGPEDVFPETREIAGVQVLTGPRGSSRQRNAALASITHQPECVLFIDDDVELDADYVRETLLCYRTQPSVAVVNGRNLAHGRYRAGECDRRQARVLIAEARGQMAVRRPEPGAITPMATSYGCRMSMRGSLLGRVHFDERLVLYGFLEDLDFALACRPFGTMVESVRALGVHLEVASGRLGGVRRGYSDVVNPLYVARKWAGYTMSRAILGSLRRTWTSAAGAMSEGDRGRLRGNLLGWRDALRGKLEPEHILEL